MTFQVVYARIETVCNCSPQVFRLRFPPGECVCVLGGGGVGSGGGAGSCLGCGFRPGNVCVGGGGGGEGDIHYISMGRDVLTTGSYFRFRTSRSLTNSAHNKVGT